MNYHKITYPDMNNGSGLRVVLWLSACSHHCYNCQNQQTWDCNSGIPFEQAARNELFDQLSKDYISGITLTGGDPLHVNNLDGVLDLVKGIRLLYPQKNIWIYTGYTWEQIFCRNESICGQGMNKIEFMRQQIVSMCDVMIDGRYVDEQRDITLKWRGSKNQRCIDIKETLRQAEIVLYCD
jgi:anaerobic ribonucleoside-triphosphate reductase activating protein